MNSAGPIQIFCVHERRRISSDKHSRSLAMRVVDIHKADTMTQVSLTHTQDTVASRQMSMPQRVYWDPVAFRLFFHVCNVYLKPDDTDCFEDNELCIERVSSKMSKFLWHRCSISYSSTSQS